MLHRIAPYVSNAAIFAGRAGHFPVPTNIQVQLKSQGLALAFRANCGRCGIASKNAKRARAASTILASEEPVIPLTAGHLATAEANVTTTPGRYASALFELASEANAIDTVQSDLERFDALVAESPDLLRLVRSPVFPADEQLQALSAVLERAGIGGLAAKFLKLVTANRRLFAVRDMVKSFRALVAAHKGEATAEVTVAEPLNDAHAAALRDALKAVSGKDVDLAIKVDPAIIGGLVVKLGSRMVDTSLRTKLNAIRHAMKEAR
jgi:F-type H+-transporting ATPase subunit delta